MTKDETTATELAWEHATRDIPEAGLSRKRAAEPEELAAVAPLRPLDQGEVFARYGHRGAWARCSKR